MRSVSAGTPCPILLLSDSLDHGGSERQLTEIAKSLDRARFAPHVAAFHTSGIRGDELRAADVPLLELRVPSLKSWRAITEARRLSAYIRRNRIALVHAFDYPTVIFSSFAAKFCRAPVVLSSQRCDRSLYAPIYIRALRLTDRVVAGIVVNTDFVRKQLTAEYGVSESRIRTCYNGIDTGVFHTGDRMSQGILKGARCVIGCVAVLRPEKSLHTLIEAFAAVRRRFDGIKLAIVGDGPCRSALVARAAELRIGEHTLFVPRTAAVADWYRQIDIFVLPSTSEALSNALLESMACGCCAVASDVGGNPEVIRNDVTGMLFPAGDAKALAGLLERLIEDPVLRTRLADAGRRSVEEQFSIAVSSRKMAEIYDEFLRARGAAHQN